MIAIPFEWRVIVADDDSTEYYFDQVEDLDNYCKELLIANKEFSFYHLEPDDSEEMKGVVIGESDYKKQEINPYELFTDIDDTPYPVPHGQFLGNFSGELSVMQIWRLSQGNETVIEDIEDLDLREKATRIFESLENIGAWDEKEEEFLNDFQLKNYQFIV